jgi:hypothetical protein
LDRTLTTGFYPQSPTKFVHMCLRTYVHSL